MFIIYDENGMFYRKTANEAEADYLASCVNGYYIEEN